MPGGDQTRKDEQLIEALLTEPTIASAATKAGLSEATVYRRLSDVEFSANYRAALRQLVEHRQDGPGLHAVGIEPGILVRRPVQVVFEQGERAGRVPLADRVEEDERAVAVEQPVGQMHAADADVGDLDAGRQVPPGQPARHLDPEPVVGEEDVADAGDEYAVH